MILFFSGCSGDNTEEELIEYETIMALVDSKEFQQREGAAAALALDSLSKLLHKFPDLVDVLSGSMQHTFFAPSNQAFIDLLATPTFPPYLREIDPVKLKAVLTYHIVEDAYLKNSVCEWGLTGKSTLYTHPHPCDFPGTVQIIKTNPDCTLLTGATNSSIDIIMADRIANNGVVHIVESLLVPPAYIEIEQPTKLSGLIFFEPDFSHFRKAITVADCDSDDTHIIVILSGAGPHTLFIPPNSAFEETAANFPGGPHTVDEFIALFTAAEWREIILNHIVSGTSNENTDLVDAFEMATMQNVNTRLIISSVTPGTPPAGSPVGKMISTSGGETGMGGTINCPIYGVDLTTSNGVAHTVGKILLPN